MATYFRSDGWVKSAIGPAVSGAQIYVCQQPANLTVPPTPLALIYSDVNGLVPITQPILTDNFGHYDFYVLPGFYTVIVALGGKIQQTYTDQSIGEAAGATPLIAGTGISIIGDTISTDLVAGPNITIVGNVISASGGGPSLALQTNGVPNGSQTILNLQAGSGITLTDNGSGQVTLVSSGSGFSTAGGAFFTGGQFFSPPTNAQVNFSNGLSLNTVIVCRLCLLAAYTVRKIAVSIVGGSGAGFNTCGVYSLDGNTLLVDAGANAFDSSSFPVYPSVTLGAPVVIGPGDYWFAYGTTGYATCGSSHPIGVTNAQWYNTFTPVETLVGTAANGLSGGALPPTLGAITTANLDIPVYTFFV